MKGGTLQNQLGFRIVGVAVLSLTALVVLLSFLTHRHMHRQTDALLLHLAHAEATGILEEGAGIHVHNMGVQLPGMTGGLSRRYALVFEPSGRILDKTSNLDPALAVPVAWTRALAGRSSWFVNTAELSEELLRFAMIPSDLDGKSVYIAVGVAHRDLDASLWAFVLIAAPTALVAAAMIGLAGIWLIRRRIVDLTRLGAACNDLELFSAGISGDRDRLALQVPDEAAREIRVLSGTLQELMDRIESLLETQNRFVAEAAHELRTPLTSLQGNLELALRRQRSAEDYREFIQEAMTDLKRLERLASDLLEGARGREGALDVSQEYLAELVGLAIQHRQQMLAQAGLSWSNQIPTDLMVAANKSGSIRVFENLLDNAIRHSGASELQFRAELKEDRVCLYIEDNGAGISGDLAERLFHPFQRGGQKGFGLGLYIARQLMRAQRGDITILKKAPGQGASWLLTFETSK